MEVNDQNLIREWLLECRSPSTARLYEYAIGVFRDWWQKPLTEFLSLETKEMRHTAILFQNALTGGWLPRNNRKKRFTPNTVTSMLTALGSFCTFNEKTLRMRGKRVRGTIDVTSHRYSTADLTKMLNVSSIQEKALLTSLCSTGWEISAVLALDPTFLRNLILKAQEQQQQFIYFLSQRGKTGAIRLGVLNPLAVEWLTEHLKTTAGPRLFAYANPDTVNKMIKRLAREAHIMVTGRVHTHRIRAWVMSGLSRAGFNEWQTKLLLGKAIPVQDMTYLETLRQEIEERYPKAYEQYLDISGKTSLGISQSDLETLREWIPFLKGLTQEDFENWREILRLQRKDSSPTGQITQ